MERITVIFARNNKPLSLLIRLFTWSRWSHCGVVDGEYVIEATALHGVVKTPLAAFLMRYNQSELADLPVAEYCDPSQFIGQRYDWLAVFAIALRRDWNSDGKWFCSELVAKTIGLFNADRVSRVTPEHLWMIRK